MKKFWEFKALADKKGELYMYGTIASEAVWESDITAKQFKADLDALGDVDTLDIYINSPGGDVFTAWAIINILQRHKAQKIGHNDGLVASAAFDIYQSLDKRIAAKASIFMTHNCWTVVMGNSKELRKAADEMDKINGLHAEIAVKKSGKSLDDINAIRDAESWYTGTEAVEEGFADEIEDKVALVACVSPEIFAKFEHPPAEIAESEPKASAEQGGFYLPADGAKARRTVSIFGQEVDEGTRPRDLLDGIDLDAPVYADNGGESQPVADIPKPDGLKEQRSHFDKIKRKILEA